MMELVADHSGPARGYVLESKLEKGRGAVATVICQQGTLQVGDHFVCGNTVGKVNSLMDSAGKRLQKVIPSIPVLVAGFSSLPEAGDFFEVIPQGEHRKARMTMEGQLIASSSKASGSKDSINIIIKTDSNSSKEALLGSIAKLSKKLEKGFNVIQASVGGINESDIALASTTGSIIYTLHSKAEPNAQVMAQKLKVSIKLFDIIYKLLEDLEAFSEGKKEIKMIKTKIGEANVLKVFDIKGLGVIAGSYIKEGRFTKDGTVVIMRDGRKVGEGAIKSLQRDRKSVKEVHTGFECAFMVEGFDEWQVDDRVECYIQVAQK
jgi:translation initiation factor IF-2